MNPVWLCAVGGLAVATYLTRSAPFFIPGIDRLPTPLTRFLELVPAAALGALIIPDAIVAAPPAVGGVTVAVAVLLAARNHSLPVVVGGAILVGWVGLLLV